MNIAVHVVPAAQQAGPGIWNQPILIAAIITFTGVLLTVVVGTAANFRLARRRNAFEQELAKQRFEYEKQLSAVKVEDDARARNEARLSASRLRHIDFERTTLLNVQEAMHSLMRHAVAIRDAKKQHFEIHGNLDAYKPDEVLWEESRQDFARATILISRISNDRIRAVVEEVKDAAGRIKARNVPWGEVEESYAETVKKGRDMIYAIGECVRQLDREELDELIPDGA